MPRINLFLCSGVCLLNATVLTAQLLPKNPTIKQVVSYQLFQQQKWNMKQLPQNSVLYKYNYSNLGLRRDEFIIKNEFKPAFTFLDQSISTSYPQQDPFLQTYLLKERKQYSQWQRQSWWKDPNQATGSELLRGFLIGNRRAF
jgi:hypothetical protein